MPSNRSAVKPSGCENVASRSKKANSSTMDFIREVKSLHYPAVKKEINAGALQWRLQNFRYGLRPYQSTCTNFKFLFH
jgi:hypothetical protein